MKQYDLAVIGAGSGGLVAATSARRAGLKTVMIEKNKIGGECTHYGCVPSKALLHTSKTYHALPDNTELGLPEVALTQPLDFGKVMEKVDEIVQGIYAHETPEVFQKQGIDVIVDPAGAQFLDPGTLRAGQVQLKAKHSIICTGSSPRRVPIPGDEGVDYLHNENFWTLRELPKKLVFIGGGVISAELGQAMARLGSQVCILDRNTRILKVTNPEVGAHISQVFETEGIRLLTSAEVIRFDTPHTMLVKQAGRVIRLEADRFFMAAGRSPNVKGLGLEQAGIAYTANGIQTNEYLQTTASNIYACGDVTTTHKFTHTASYQAGICLHNILHGNSKPSDLSVLPWAIFTQPEIGHVGLSEAEARRLYGADLDIFKVDAAIDRFITDRKRGGFLQVMFAPNQQVVGAQAIGAHAGEWIQLLTLAIRHRISAKEMADTIFSYPTYSEIVKKAFTRFLRTKN